MTTSKRAYNKRSPGDIINGAVLLERVDNRLWKMQCSCGETFVAQSSNTSGRCWKCGHMQTALSNTKHGESPRPGRNATRLYGIWAGMRIGCNDPRNHAYSTYGGRGIKVCNEWSDYLTFKDWALSHGYSDELTLDRIDVNGNYQPDNCRWATWEVQRKNKRKNPYLYGRDEFGRFKKKEDSNGRADNKG